MPRLPQDQRDRALGMFQAGLSQRRIARTLGVHVSTVNRLILRHNTTDSTRDRPRPGQPRVTTPRQDRNLTFRHIRNRFLTAAETARALIGNRGRPIHKRTVTRRLQQRGMRCRRPYNGNILTHRHRTVRLAWARQHLQRGARFWTNVIFSDESRFSVSSADGRQRVYRRRNERYAQCCVLERNRFGGGSVMVWGAINHRFKSQLVIVNGNLNAQRYIDQILRPVVIPLIQQRGRHMHFQQDNATPHSARLTQNFLQNNGVNVLAWPANSPDLNPIEHLWDELGRRVRQRQPPPRNVAQLTAALQAEWNAIPQPTIRNLCESMGRRLNTCIRANGGHNRY